MLKLLKKTIRFTFFNWIVEADLRARHRFSHFRIHRTEYSRHLVWGRLSILLTNWTIECHALCGECGSASIGGIGAGDESWTVCESCRSVEGRINYVNFVEYENADYV